MNTTRRLMRYGVFLIVVAAVLLVWDVGGGEPRSRGILDDIMG